MTGEIDAAGDLMSGALLARAIEPGAGGGRAAHPALCLNCGTTLIGPHCHRCGQSGHVHRTVGAIGHEIAHGVFHVEGRIWRTVPMLVLHPGKLTRRYIDGERVRFVSPLALFLFTVFLLFATISWVGGDIDGIRYSPQATKRVMTKIAAQTSALDAERATLTANRTMALAQGKPVAKIDEDLRGLAATRHGLDVAAATLGQTPTTEIVSNLHTGWARLDRGIAHANDNPGLALYKLQSSAYKYSWLLIPLSTPFVALLFLWRRRYGLYDHAVFVTYSLSFMMLLCVALTLAGAAGLAAGWIALAALAVPPIHLFAQLRGTYAIGRWGAGWRTVALLGFAFAVLLGFATLLLLHGLTD